MSEPPRYPNVRCDSHGDHTPGYIICRHVIAGARIVGEKDATPTELGQLLCAECFESTYKPEIFGALVLICGKCAIVNVLSKRQ